MQARSLLQNSHNLGHRRYVEPAIYTVMIPTYILSHPTGQTAYTTKLKIRT